MSLVPTPVPLDPPPGLPGAVEEAARAMSAAARLLDELADRLAAARVPAWQGDDAEAAEARCAGIAHLAAGAVGSLHRVAVRLAAHADVLGEVRRRIAVLQAAQDAEFAVVRSRVALRLDPSDPLAPDPAEALAALRSAEADRAAEHARLTALADDDAAETVRVLNAAAAGIAGTPRYDPDVALLRLAALLPAWGTPQVGRRGFLLARAAGKPGVTTDDLARISAEDLDLAADPEYANALLTALTPERARDWLSQAWSGVPADDPRTGLFARVLSGLERDSSGPPWLPALLDGASEAGVLAGVAGGLGAVLARARATGLAGPPPPLAAAWTRSLARDERRTGHPTDLGPLPAGVDPMATDPLALLADVIVEHRAALEAARMMSDRDAWAVVLSRTWNDPALRDSVVLLAADAPAPVARPALRDALVSLGTGLADGDPADWAFDDDTIPRVAPLVAAALLRHPDVLAGPLAAVAAGTADAVSVTALRGLAVLVALDEGPRGRRRGHVGDRVAAALSSPAPGALADGGPAARVAVSAAFVGVREHGARLAQVMEQFDRKAAAEAKAQIWDATVGVGFTVASFVPETAAVATPVEVVVTDALGVDGYFTNSPDRQRHHPAAEAVAVAVTTAIAAGDDPGAAAREALTAHRRTLQALGTPVAPKARPVGLGTKLVEAEMTEALGGMAGRALPFLPRPLRDVAGGALVDFGGDLVGWPG